MMQCKHTCLILLLQHTINLLFTEDNKQKIYCLLLTCIKNWRSSETLFISLTAVLVILLLLHILGELQTQFDDIRHMNTYGIKPRYQLRLVESQH